MFNTLGIQSDALVMRGLSESVRKDGYIRFSTPTEPDFWFGNMLVVQDIRFSADALIDLFVQEFPQAQHRCFCWDMTALGRMPVHDDLKEAGYVLDETDVLAYRSNTWPDPRATDFEIRELTTESDWERAIALQLELSLEAGYVADMHEPFVRGRFSNRRKQIERCEGAWFGAFDGDELVGDLGIFTDGQVARYQAVETRKSHRRRGICSALVLTALAWAKTRDENVIPVMLADQNDVATKLYQSLGFQLEERLIAAYLPSPGAKS